MSDYFSHYLAECLTIWLSISISNNLTIWQTNGLISWLITRNPIHVIHTVSKSVIHSNAYRKKSKRRRADYRTHNRHVIRTYIDTAATGCMNPRIIQVWNVLEHQKWITLMIKLNTSSLTQINSWKIYFYKLFHLVPTGIFMNIIYFNLAA